jgi:hypothetical protein
VIVILIPASVEALQNRTRLRGSTARVHHWHTRNGCSPARKGIVSAIVECAADGRELGSMDGRVIVELVVMIPALPGRFLNANDNTFVDNAEYRLAA